MPMSYDNIEQDITQAIHAYVTGMQLLASSLTNPFLFCNLDKSRLLEREILPAFISVELPLMEKWVENLGE